MQIEKILLVDDDQNTRVVAQMGIEGLTDWKVELAKSGAEALVKAAYMQPDVIVIAYNMSGMDGPATLEQLRKNTQINNIPVIFMGTKIKSQDLKRYSNMGVAGQINKPIDAATLADEIIGVLSRAGVS